MTLADAVKCKDERRTRLAPNALVSLAVEESVDIRTKARAENNVVINHMYIYTMKQNYMKHLATMVRILMTSVASA